MLTKHPLMFLVFRFKEYFLKNLFWTLYQMTDSYHIGSLQYQKAKSCQTTHLVMSQSNHSLSFSLCICMCMDARERTIAILYPFAIHLTFIITFLNRFSYTTKLSQCQHYHSSLKPQTHYQVKKWMQRHSSFHRCVGVDHPPQP